MQGSTKRRRHSSFFLDLPKVLVVWFFKTYCKPYEAYAVHLAHVSNISPAQAQLLAELAAYFDCVELTQKCLKHYAGLEIQKLINKAFYGDALEVCKTLTGSFVHWINNAASLGKPKIFAYLLYDSVPIDSVCRGANVEIIRTCIDKFPNTKRQILKGLIQFNQCATLQQLEGWIENRDLCMQHAAWYKAWDVLIWLNGGSEDFSACTCLHGTWTYFKACDVEGVQWLMERGLKFPTLSYYQIEDMTVRHKLMVLGIKVRSYGGPVDFLELDPSYKIVYEGNNTYALVKKKI